MGAFSLLTQELAEQGCHPVVLGLVARAAADEARHTVLCSRMAAAVLDDGAAPRTWRGLPKVPPHPERDASARVLLHVVEMCCLGETLSSVFLSETVARSGNPQARAIVQLLLEDEIGHARVGWAYLATRARGASLNGLHEALPAMLERTFGRALQHVEVDDDDTMEAFGYVRQAATPAIVRRALRDVVVPGFETLGVDLSPARATVARMLH